MAFTTRNNLAQKLLIVYRRNFKVIIMLNMILSFFLFESLKSQLVEIPYSVLPMLVFIKLMGYGSSVLIELVFQPERRVFFYNLGLSYTRIFSFIFLFDSLILLSFIAVWTFLLN